MSWSEDKRDIDAPVFIVLSTLLLFKVGDEEFYLFEVTD